MFILNTIVIIIIVSDVSWLLKVYQFDFRNKRHGRNDVNVVVAFN